MRWRPSKLTLPATVRSGLSDQGTTQLAHEDACRSFGQRVEQQFDILSKLGSGSTSTVSKARWKVDGSLVAVKVTRSSDADMVHHARREYELLKRLSYPSIPCVRHFEACLQQGRAAMVMDYFGGMELQKAVTSAGRVDETTAHVWGMQLLSTVAYLHRQRVLHRDIKPQNIIVSSDLQRIMLVDFNASHCLRDGEPLTPTGTRLYAAPEVLIGGAASSASDVWGAGVCLYFTLCGRLPQGRNEMKDTFTLEAAATKEVSFPSKWWSHVSGPCVSCLRRCLVVAELGRPSAEELLADSWLGGSEPAPAPRQSGTEAPSSRGRDEAP